VLNGPAVSDRTIDACRWHVDAESAQYKERALSHFRDRYTVLLGFLRAEGLLNQAGFGEGVKDWLSFVLRESDLTPEGMDLVKRCHGTWSPSFGQGHTQRHLAQWKRKLKEMRSQ